MRRRALEAALVAWGGIVLWLFCRSSRDLLGSAAACLATLGLGGLSCYAIWLTGFRAGRRLFPADAEARDPIDASSLELGLGAGVVIGAVVCLGALGLFRPWAAWGLLGFLLAGPHGAFVREIAARARTLGAGRDREHVLGAAAIAAGLMTLAASLSPVTSQDALVYHLAVPAKYIASGGFVHVEGSFFASFPQNVEMLFTLGLLLQGEALAQWYHWMLWAGSALAVAALARRIQPDAPGLLAALVFATVPTALLIAGWAYVDLGVVFFVTLSTTCFPRWRATGGRWLFISALFAGLAAGCKYTAGFQGIVLVVAAFAAVLAESRSLRVAMGKSAAAALVVGAAASPWWIKNVAFTGNPVHPFLHGLFGGRDWDAGRAEVLGMALGQWGGPRGFLETISLPWRVTMSGRFFSEEAFDGMIGAAFLGAAPLVLWGLRVSRAHRWACLFAALHAVAWATLTRQVRFLLPSLAIVSALVAAALPHVVHAGSRRALGHVVRAAVLVNVLVASLHFASHNPLPVVLGLESKAEFMRRELPGGDYDVFERIEKDLPEDAYILFGSLGGVGFLSKRRYHADAFFENRTLASILASADGPDGAWRCLRERGFTHLLFRTENVFDPSGKRSEIPLGDQLKLMEMLNRSSRLVARAGATVLYELSR